MKFLPPPHNLSVRGALKGLLFAALFAFGAAQAAPSVVFLSTDETQREDGKDGNGLGLVNNGYKAFCGENGEECALDGRGALTGSAPLDEEKVKAIKEADIVVIVTVYNPVHEDKFEFIKGLMEKTDPDNPQTFVIASDGCGECSNDKNFNNFARAIADMAGWNTSAGEGKVQRNAGANGILSPLNEGSPFSGSFRGTLPLIDGWAYSYMENVPSELALYTVPGVTPQPPAGQENAFGMFLPKAYTKKGEGACTFLVGDASIFSRSSAPEQPKDFATAFLSAAAAAVGGDCACNLPALARQEQCDEADGCDPDAPGTPQDPDPDNPGDPLKITPIQLTCSAEDVDLRVPKTVPLKTDKYWSVKGAAGGLGGGAWIRPHEPSLPEEGIGDKWQDAGSALGGAKWITPGVAVPVPVPPTTAAINTEDAYLFARAVRVGKLAAGESVQVARAQYLVDNKLNDAWVGDSAAEVNTGLYDHPAGGDVTRNDGLGGGFSTVADLDVSQLDDFTFTGGKTNWLIFQVKNSESTHDAGHPTGFAASIELQATLDCSANCASGEFDADGKCLPPPAPVCAPPSGCSSAPVAGWPALLGLGVALPLLARRRRRK